MTNKPGPRKKHGDRYPSGGLKPAIAPAVWGRIRDLLPDHRLSSELGRLWLHRELSDTQAAAGFIVAEICCRKEFGEGANKLTNTVTARARGDTHDGEGDRKALDDLLSGCPPKVRAAVIELCVSNRTIDWKLRPDIRAVLDHVSEVWSDAVRQQAASLSKLRSGGPPRRRREPESVELGADLDPDVEAVKKLIAVLEPQMDTAGKASLVEHCLALRDREEFRQEKIDARQHENVQPSGRRSKAVGN